MNFLSQHPSFRLLLPMMVGIVCGNYIDDTKWASISLPIFIAILAMCWVAWRKHWISMFGTGVFLIFLYIGYVSTVQELQLSRAVFPNEPVVCQVSVTDIPKEKEKTLQCLVCVENVWTNHTKIDSLEGKRLILYISKDSSAMQLVRGDKLWVYTKLKKPVENHLPGVFDYARYLRHRGICGTAYVATGNWKIREHHEIRTIESLAQDYRIKVKNLYRDLGFQGDELAVLSALTIGEKDGLDEDIKETYSIAGASHVLAISGLHVGLVYSLLWLLLERCWRRWKFLKIPLYGFILFILWIFALFTGFSTSVVRAVWMCSLFLLFSFRLEPILSMDTLLAAAFFMLLCKPLWLFDVGCQLSFAAVASILLIYPGLYGRFSIRNRALRKLWGLVSVSIAAQIGTAPLVIFYFSRFSTHFLITNIWVIPLVTLVMYTSVVMWLLFPFPCLQEKMALILNGLLHFQNEGLRWIEQLPLASVDGISIELWEVFLCYLCVMLGVVVCRKALFSNVILFLGVCLLWAVLHGINVYKYAPHTGIAFYSAHGCTAVHCLSDNSRSWLVTADSLSRVSSLKRLLVPYWNRMCLDVPLSINNDYVSDKIWVRQQILCYQGKTVCILSDNRWKDCYSARPLQLDYLLVTHSYRGSIKELLSLFAMHTVIVDETLPDYYKKLIQADCVSIGLPCVMLREQSCLEYTL